MGKIEHKPAYLGSVWKSVKNNIGVEGSITSFKCVKESV